MSTPLTEYFPFDAGAGANVTEAQWREMARLWLPTGIIPAADSSLNELAVSQRGAGANMSVDVATGWAWILGEFGALTVATNVGISANATGNPRIDLVVLRADFVNNNVVLDVLVGTPAVAPVEPVLTQNSSMWEIPLAAIDVAAAAVSILTASIRDRRVFARSLPEAANKEPARAATTAALAASTVTGTTRVANANGALPAQDGVTLVAGDRLLDKDHATTAQRGLWRVVDPGSASRPWTLERPPDFDSSSDVRAGVWIKVTEGTVAADTGWLLTTNDPITLGTTGLTFAQFPSGGSSYGCRAIVDTPQVVNHVTLTAIQFGAANSWGPTSVHDPASNNTRFIADRAGLWEFSLMLNAIAAASAASIFAVPVRKNGTTVIAETNMTGPQGSWSGLDFTDTVSLAANDYIEFLLYQNCGNTATIEDTGASSVSTDNTGTRCTFRYVGPVPA